MSDSFAEFAAESPAEKVDETRFSFGRLAAATRVK
jgi:hypothetical protein